MEYNAFTAGIEPGGLRNKNEIRILLCYLLSSVRAPLSKSDIISIMQENALANYFEVTDALSELIENGNVLMEEGTELCSASDSARLVAQQLDTALPPSVRDRAVGAAVNLLARAKRERENKVEISKTDLGYNVTCHISGGDMELMSFQIYVPDLKQARMVKRNFHREPENVYRVMLALVTGNHDLVADILKDLAGSPGLF